MTKKNIPTLSYRNLVIVLVGGLLAFSLFVIASLILAALFMKPIGDDYSFLNSFHNVSLQEWLTNTWQYFTTQNGRYGQNISAAITYGVLGSKSSIILSLTTIVVMLILGYVFVITYLHKNALFVDRVKPFVAAGASIILVSTLLIVTVDNPPDVWGTFQIASWGTGILTYTLPLLILLATSAWLYRKSTPLSRRDGILFFSLIVISSLFNEILPLTVIAASGVNLAVTFIKKRTIQLPAIRIPAIYIAGSFTGLLAIYFSPALQHRREVLNSSASSAHHTPLAQDVMNVMSNIMDLYLTKPFLSLLVSIGIIAALATYLKINSRQTSTKLTSPLLLLGIVSIIVGVLGMIIALALLAIGYGSANIQPRTLFYSLTSLSIGILLLSYVAGIAIIERTRKLGHLIMAVVALLLLSLHLSFFLHRVMGQVAAVVGYSNQWVVQDRELREASAKSLPIYYGEAVGIGDGFSLSCYGPYAKNTTWLNDELEVYYKVKQVCAANERPNPKVAP